MTDRRRAAIVAAALLTLAAATQATPTPLPEAVTGLAFEAFTAPGGGQPFDLAAADLDGDGVVDLLSSNPKENALAVHRGLGGGRLDASRSIRTGKFPRGVALADFDRDGHLDVAAAANMAGTVAIHRGDGRGGFAGATQIPVGSHPFMLAAGDLNGDAAPDVAVALEGAGQVAVLLNDGRGGFAQPSLVEVGKSPAAVAIGDVNRDGAADLATICWGSTEAVISLGDGRGGFAAPRRIAADGRGQYGIALADLDGDADLDLAWTDVQRQAVIIRWGDGRGGFPRESEVATGAGVRDVAIADLNADGHPDLAASNMADGSVSVALADGRGGFQPSQRVAVGAQPRVVAAADLDGDGRVDLATTNMLSNDLTTLRNAGAATVDVRPTTTPVPSPQADYDPSVFHHPNGIALDGRGHLYVSDQFQHRIARVDLADGAITTVAGSGAAGDGGDGGPATAARLELPGGVAVDRDGNLFIADHGNHRIRKVDAAGIITTVAGTGEAGFSGDGGPATTAQLSHPFAIAFDPQGRLVISDFGNARIRRVEADGTIHTIMGTGIPNAAGDGGPGTAASMRSASALAFDRDGNLLIAEQYSMRIRRLAPDGTVTTFAGTGMQGSSGDGGPATAATFQYPAGVAAGPDGSVFVSDQDGIKLRRIAPDGTISTFAGIGVAGYEGDGGPATAARIWFPFGLAVDAHGTVYFADRYNNAIRKVDVGGVIHTVAGGPRSLPWEDIARLAPTPPALQTPAGAAPALVWDEAFYSGSDANAARAVAVGEDGTLYVAGDLGSGADWAVLALKPDGGSRWKQQIKTGGVEIPNALALAADGTLVVAGEQSAATSGKDLLVLGLDAASGRERWRHAVAEPGNQVAHALAVDRAGTIYVVGESQNQWLLLALNANGTPRWSVRDGTGTARGVALDPQGNPVVAGDTRMLWRVDKRAAADGASLWRRDVAPARQRAHGAQANAVRVDGDGAITVTGMWTAPEGRTLRVERRGADGAEQWSYIEPPGDAGNAGRALALGAGGAVYVAGVGNTDWLLLALDPKGGLLWRLAHDGGGGKINPDIAMALAVVPPDDLLVAGVLHPVPPKLPNLGWIQWRIARYALP